MPAVLVYFEYNSNRTSIHIGSSIFKHVQHACNSTLSTVSGSWKCFCEHPPALGRVRDIWEITASAGNSLDTFRKRKVSILANWVR